MKNEIYFQLNCFPTSSVYVSIIWEHVMQFLLACTSPAHAIHRIAQYSPSPSECSLVIYFGADLSMIQLRIHFDTSNTCTNCFVC